MAAELSRTEVLHTDFISNLSHEIKTPLAVIQNYATSLQSKKLSEETRIQYAETLSSAAKKLTTLVTNILKLNKLENQELSPEKEQINLTDMLAETIFGFEDLIEQKQLTLDCDLQENVVIVSTPSYLEIVWNNLLSNAIKFTPKGKGVEVYYQREGDLARICVRDHGVGIEAERVETIFHKGETTYGTGGEEGSGLGLQLCQEFARRNGGEAKVESTLGEGSTFSFTIPLKQEEV